MKRTTRWAVVAGVIGLVAYVVVGSMARVERECELCMEFNGQTLCRTGAGATEAEARQAARTAACALLAFDMASSIQCENTVPKTERCTAVP